MEHKTLQETIIDTLMAKLASTGQFDASEAQCIKTILMSSKSPEDASLDLLSSIGGICNENQ